MGILRQMRSGMDKKKLFIVSNQLVPLANIGLRRARTIRGAFLIRKDRRVAWGQ
jgi:hypothetical protein